MRVAGWQTSAKGAVFKLVAWRSSPMGSFRSLTGSLACPISALARAGLRADRSDKSDARGIQV
jgi:hypothetical protein